MLQRAGFCLVDSPGNRRGFLNRRRQYGQAAVYGLFVIVGCVVALFFLFNTGQLSSEKTKLVNAGDAVAYSAGIMNARTLNYEAYANRAMLANTVAIAQLVSLSSWISYVETMATWGQGVNWAKYMVYYPSYTLANSSAQYLGYLNEENGSLQQLAEMSDQLIRVRLMTAQQVAYAGLIPARAQLMNEVAQANYRNDGAIIVDPLSLSGEEITSFASRYTDDERTRFADAARTAANEDSFLPKRSWLMPAMFPEGCPYLFDWLSRRGGTELIGFDEWKALDTLSEWRWKMTKSGACVLAEYPVGYGSQNAADDSGADTDFTRYDYARIVNPTSSLLALGTSSSAWNYSGLPAFYDLSEDELEKDDPTLRFAVRLRRDISQTRTSEGRSAVRNSGSANRIGQSLNNFQADPAGGDELVAVSASEVFFAREEDNAHGKEIGKPREMASLFNPFWHVRLVSAENEARAAQLLQGAVLP